MTMILDTTICSLSEYERQRKELLERELEENGEIPKRRRNLLVPQRPRQCPECEKEDSFWVHSYWYRRAIEGDVKIVVPVPRFECRFCGTVISVMFAFLVPFRPFTVRAMAAAVEEYVQEPTTYHSAENNGASPSPAQVWRWVDMFASKSKRFLGLKLQRACVVSNQSELLISVTNRVCPNGSKARSREKADKLNCAARSLALSRVLLNVNTDVIVSLQTHFVKKVQNPFSILTGRGLVLFTPQSLQYAV